MPTFTDSLAALSDLSVPFAPVPAASLDDAGLLTAQRTVAELRRRVEAQAAVVAAEIAHRSRRELGHGGLAQSNGQRTPEGLISQLTGSSTREARTLVRAGELLSSLEVARTEAADAADAPATPRWLTEIGDALTRATISTEAAEVIRTRLAEAARRLDTAELDDAARTALDRDLAAAAERLIARASTMPIEQLAQHAARERDELDLVGVPSREEELREKRFLRVTKQLDGMTRVHGLLDPESAAIVVPILDAATSPRRGGPRFVDPTATARAEDVVRDTRSTEQLALDTLVELIRIGARVDDGTLLGDRKPAVRVLVTKTDLESDRDTSGNRSGVAFFEGQDTAVSVSTAKRFICSSGAIPILFDDDGKVLNLGREQRLFTEKQRIAMAARDGGCRMCGRPPSWCEAHHIDHWEEHHGETNVDDGVLLCRFCHLLVHNRGWRITRQGGDYFLERPDDDGILRRISLPSRSPALERLLATA